MKDYYYNQNLNNIKCNICKGNMEYREFYFDRNQNGYYCTQCTYTELDKDLDLNFTIEDQIERIIL